MKKYFVNTTGRMFFFNKLGGKQVSADPSKVIIFEEGDIQREELLELLVNNGSFREIEKPAAVEISTSPIKEEVKYQEFPRGPKENIAESLGAPQSPVSIDPSRMSRVTDFVPAKPEEDLAYDPSRMSRFQEAQESLGKRVEGRIDANTDYKSDVVPASQYKPSILGVNQTPQKKNEKIVEVWWSGPANDAGGYGKMNRESVEGLHKKGAKVQLDLFRIPDMRCSVGITPSLQTMMKNKVSENAPSVWAVMPPRGYFRAGKKILYTMMETGELPDTFADKCVYADEVWLPSKFNMEVFQRGFEKRGEKVNLVYMPLGIDPNLYKPIRITAEQRQKFDHIKTKDFVFMSLFGWSLRKGVDVLFKAYLEAFSGDDNVTLLIVSRKDGSSSAEKNKEIHEQIAKYIKRWNPTNPPHVVHVGEAMEESLLPLLYNMSHCFLLPTRGEGFNLPLAEAGACEIPVIATRCGGQLDFLNDDNSFLIDIEGYDLGSQEIRGLSSYYQDSPFAVVGNKATEQLKETMVDVIRNYSQAKVKAGNLRKNLVNNFTWDILVNRIYKNLEGSQA